MVHGDGPLSCPGRALGKVERHNSAQPTHNRKVHGDQVSCLLVFLLDYLG